MVIVRLGLDQADRKWTDAEQGEFLRLVGEARNSLPSGAATGRLESRHSDGDGSVTVSGSIHAAAARFSRATWLP
jgi:hypothetical protein